MSSSFIDSGHLRSTRIGMNGERHQSYNESYGSLGLHQRRGGWKDPNNANGKTNDENNNPNSLIRNRKSRENWGASKNRPAAPPRLSLASVGKCAFATSAAYGNTGTISDITNTAVGDSTSAEKSSVALNDSISFSRKNEEQELSLWVVAFGFRTKSQYRATLKLLESCGAITSRRGGLFPMSSIEGADELEQSDEDRSHENNWVALRFGSAIAATKARCQHNAVLTVERSIMVLGVTSIEESGVIVKLGIDVNTLETSSSSLLTSSLGTGENKRNIVAGDLVNESDILLYGKDQDSAVDRNGPADSLCGKIFAWFFMWDVQK